MTLQLRPGRSFGSPSYASTTYPRVRRNEHRTASKRPGADCGAPRGRGGHTVLALAGRAGCVGGAGARAGPAGEPEGDEEDWGEGVCLHVLTQYKLSTVYGEPPLWMKSLLRPSNAAMSSRTWTWGVSHQLNSLSSLISSHCRNSSSMK